MRVLVTGSIQWTDADAIRRELVQLPPGSVVIHGDCTGADALAGEIAHEPTRLFTRFAKRGTRPTTIIVATRRPRGRD